jgi:hypothetical protein
MKLFAPITMDDSLWPLVIVHLVGTASLADFEAYQEKRLELLRRGPPHLVVVEVDASRGIVLPNEHRQKHVEWLVRHEELIRQRLLGVAYATDSAIFRLTLSLVFHIKSPACPYVITPSLEQAVAWAESRLAEAGLHEDAERIRYHFGLQHHRSHA